MDIEWLNIPFLLPGIFRGTHPKHWFLFWYNVESVDILSKFDWVILKISTFDWVILKTCNTWYSDETFAYKGAVLLTLTSSSQGSTIHLQAPENAPNIRNYQILSTNVRKTVRYGLQIISYRSPLLWENLPQWYNSKKSLSIFRK